MFPTITILGRTFGSYTLLATVGALIAGVYAMSMTKKRGGNDNHMLILLLLAAVGGVVGSHLLYGIVNFNAVRNAILSSDKAWSLSYFWTIIQVLMGGSVFYGGLLGGLAVGVLYIRKKRLPLGETSDVAAPAIPLFHTFGRIGCFLGGCCYGVESGVGVIVHHALVEEANNVRRFPVQLLEASCNLALFFLLHWMLKRGRLKGHLLSLYLGLYALLRFGLEFLRGDSYRGFLGIFSTSQLISMAILLALAVRMVLLLQKRKKE